jgi:hypothetical protein
VTPVPINQTVVPTRGGLDLRPSAESILTYAAARWEQGLVPPVVLVEGITNAGSAASELRTILHADPRGYGVTVTSQTNAQYPAVLALMTDTERQTVTVRTVLVNPNAITAPIRAVQRHTAIAGDDPDLLLIAEVVRVPDRMAALYLHGDPVSGGPANGTTGALAPVSDVEVWLDDVVDWLEYSGVVAPDGLMLAACGVGDPARTADLARRVANKIAARPGLGVAPLVHANVADMYVSPNTGRMRAVELPAHLRGRGNAPGSDGFLTYRPDPAPGQRARPQPIESAPIPFTHEPRSRTVQLSGVSGEPASLTDELSTPGTSIPKLGTDGRPVTLVTRADPAVAPSAPPVSPDRREQRSWSSSWIARPRNPWILQ